MENMKRALKRAFMVRQGDVLIRRVASAPAGKPVAREAGRIVLAHGEATGHAHAIADPEADLIITDEKRRYLIARSPVTLGHEEHSPIELDEGTYEIIRQMEYQPEEVRYVAD